MTVTIDLCPDTEARLAEIAAAHGLSLAHYLRRVLEEQIVAPPSAAVSPSERAAMWRAGVLLLPVTAPLPADAISRDSIYDARG
jgi:hypothetical protein